MKFPYNIGDHIEVNGDKGFITFIASEYLTLCTHQWDNPNTLHGYSQTKLLVYPSDWDKIVLIKRAEDTKE